MRKELLVGVGAGLALAAVTATDASACGRRSGVCGDDAPAAVYRYAPPPRAYGYLAPAPVYGYAPPPAPVYELPVAVGDAYAPPAYGYRGWRGCDRGYGFAPPVAYDGYRPAAVWAPAR